MENCDLIIKEESNSEENGFFTIRELSEDDEELSEVEELLKDDEFMEEPIIGRVSATVQPIQCKICSKGFFPKEFEIHSATAHITTTNCDICNESFPSNWYLARHATICKSNNRTSSGITKDAEKNLICDCCGKQFYSIWDLKLHATACRPKIIRPKNVPKIKKPLKVMKKQTNKRKKIIVYNEIFMQNLLLAKPSISNDYNHGDDENLLKVLVRK